MIIILCQFINPAVGAIDWGPAAEKLGNSYGVLFSILFVALSITVTVLIRKLNNKNKTLVEDAHEYRDFFRQETRALTYILITFSISYLLRVCYDLGV
jgi:hypothetical protein